MHPQRVKISTIRPSKRPEFDSDLLKQVSIFEGCEDSCIRTIHQRQYIHDATRAVVAGD